VTVNKDSTQSLHFAQLTLPDLSPNLPSVPYDRTPHEGIDMRTHIFGCLLAGFAIVGAALWSPPAEINAEADQIDFVSLRSEATSAMHLLEVAQERRMASLQTEEF
jgi:hypothetical protein